MKSLSYSLTKYIALLLALVFTTGNIFYQIPGKGNLIIIQIALGVVFLAFSVLEFTKQMEKSKLPNDRFFYLPLSFMSFKFIKLGAYTLACILLFLSETNLVFLGGLLLMLIVTDLLIFLLRIKKKFYFVSLFANYILFSMEDEKQVFASNVKIVEYRYEVFYIKLNSGKTYNIEIACIEKSQQAAFIEKFVLWVVCNKLHFTDEAKVKLADVIATVS